MMTPKGPYFFMLPFMVVQSLCVCSFLELTFKLKERYALPTCQTKCFGPLSGNIP